MRFLVDECTGPAVAQWLREQQHEVFSVYEAARGMADEEVIQKGVRRELDFSDKRQRIRGESLSRERRPHRGVVFLRLQDERAANKITVLRHLLAR